MTDFTCQCTILTMGCQLRATQEDMLCDGCRSHKCNTAIFGFVSGEQMHAVIDEMDIQWKQQNLKVADPKPRNFYGNGSGSDGATDA